MAVAAVATVRRVAVAERSGVRVGAIGDTGSHGTTWRLHAEFELVHLAEGIRLLPAAVYARSTPLWQCYLSTSKLQI